MTVRQSMDTVGPDKTPTNTQINIIYEYKQTVRACLASQHKCHEHLVHSQSVSLHGHGHRPTKSYECKAQRMRLTVVVKSGMSRVEGTCTNQVQVTINCLQGPFRGEMKYCYSLASSLHGRDQCAAN